MRKQLASRALPRAQLAVTTEIGPSEPGAEPADAEQPPPVGAKAQLPELLQLEAMLASRPAALLTLSPKKTPALRQFAIEVESAG